LRIELLKNHFGEWFFCVVAANNRIICQSESYSAKNKAKKGIEALRKCSKAKVVEVPF
jgi:uncharacterized protein YegP (UPF0339 family)